MILNIDVALWTLVIFLNVLGVWIAKFGFKDKVVPLTLILGLLSLLLCTIWGYMCGYGTFVSYGLPNGILSWFVCTQLYDVIHESFTKRKDKWSKLLSAVKGLFKKEVTA